MAYSSLFQDLNQQQQSIITNDYHDDYQHYDQKNMMCPCPQPYPYHHSSPYRIDSHSPRWLQEEMDDDVTSSGGGEEEELVTWEVVYTCLVLLYMFVALLSDRYGADSIMITALTLFMASGIITVEEGLQGFSNEGLMTVLSLFVVADGISKTGALDWYMGKLLGRPNSTASAQMRLMAPISIVSAFLNNTPVVAVMIPIVQRWAKNIKISVQQLLIPLSFASILGGTCTLIGTSTNLVVVGLLNERYPDDPDVYISLFELGIYGVPIAFAGISYILLATPSLLPGGTGSCPCTKKKDGDGDDDYYGAINLDAQEDVLLGARLTPWSPAAGRSVKRSGLRDTGGIYLVSVHRAETGNIHRAVGQDFVLNVGDVLYFTGLIDGFGEFCEEHGMELLTHGSPATTDGQQQDIHPENKANSAGETLSEGTLTDHSGLRGEIPTSAATGTIDHRHKSSAALPSVASELVLGTVVEGECEGGEEDELMGLPCEVGVTKESLMNADDAERSRSITRMIDLIRGHAREEPTENEDYLILGGTRPTDDLVGAPKVVVASEHEFVIVGINSPDRPGLLLDISKGLSRLGMNLRHTEASVVVKRSISIWRCEMVDSEIPDLEEIWSVMNALLENDAGSQAVKQRGLRVIRAVITKTSTLIGKTASDVDFRKLYKAGIVAVQKGGKNVPLSGVVFGSGDVLILQASEDSPLLKAPPEDFYNRMSDMNNKDGVTLSRSSSLVSFIKSAIKKSISNPTLNVDEDENDVEEGKEQQQKQQVEGNSDGDRNKRLSRDSVDDDYKLGSSFLDDDEISGDLYDQQASQNIISDMERIMAEEEAWKDLHVIFANNDGKRNADEVGGTREFLAAMEIPPASRLANRTVAESGLDKLPGVYLVSIDRPREPKVKVITRRADGSSIVNDDLSAANNTLQTIEQIFTAVSPEMPLMEGDVLWYAGSASALGVSED